MSTDFITKETDKILNDEKYSYPLNIAMASAWIMGNFKGTNLKVYDVKKLTAIADYFVLCSAENPMQAAAIADEIGRMAKQNDETILSQEGRGESDWVLIDIANIIVHIFLDTAREKYALDELWSKATQVEIPESYYFAHPEMEKRTTEPQGNYF